MNYELCKRLKDAGFPQRILTTANVKQSDLDAMRAAREGLRVSTLEELIEACGQTFRDLEKYSNTENGVIIYKWQANAYNESTRPYEVAKGKGVTPTEAVANLWLALQTKTTE